MLHRIILSYSKCEYTAYTRQIMSHKNHSVLQFFFKNIRLSINPANVSDTKNKITFPLDESCGRLIDITS